MAKRAVAETVILEGLGGREIVLGIQKLDKMGLVWHRGSGKKLEYLLSPGMTQCKGFGGGRQQLGGS